MAQKKKPIHEIRFGAIRATIWANDTSSGDRWYTVITSRQYKDEQDHWQVTHSFKVQHLPNLAKAIEAANLWIEQHSVTPEAKRLVSDLVKRATNSSRKTERRAS